MSEAVVKTAPTKIGLATKFDFNNASSSNGGEEGQEQGGDNKNGDGGGDNKGGDNGEVVVPDLSFDQIKAALKKSGIEFDGDENALKEKFAVQQQQQQKSPEEILAEQQKLNKAMLDIYLSGGGKIEDFVTVSKVAAAENLTDVVIGQIKEEMKAAGFDDNEIEAEIKSRYYMMDLATIEQGDEETPEAFEARKKALEKKIAYGQSKINGRSTSMKQKATSILDTLKQAISNNESQVQSENKLSSMVDEFFSKINRDVNLELGKAGDGQDIAPVQYKISDEEIDEVKSLLKDAQKRKQILFTDDGSINPTSVGQILLENKYLKSALKSTFIEGGNRTIEKLKVVFPGINMADVGLGGGGKQPSEKGKIAAAGKPQPASR